MHKTGLQNNKLQIYKIHKLKPTLIEKHLKFLYIFSQYFQIEDKVDKFIKPLEIASVR